MSGRMPSQQRKDLLLHPRDMPKFDCIGTTLWQLAQKRVEPWSVFPQHRRQLPQNRPDPLFQRFNMLEKLIERPIQLGQFFHMGDEPASFYSVHKTRWGFVPPPFHHVHSWQAVKGIINFHRWELRRVKFKMARLRRIRWVKRLLPT